MTVKIFRLKGQRSRS